MKPVTKSGEEESIDDYMAKLLARVRGPGGAPLDMTVEIPKPAKKSTKKAKKAAADAEGTQAKVDQNSAAEGEMSPRAVAPEKTFNISAYRELANMSASSAISSHRMKETATHSKAKLIVTGVAVAMGVAMLVLWRMPNASPYLLYGAVASFGISMGWGVQFALLYAKQSTTLKNRADRILQAKEPMAEIPLSEVVRASDEQAASTIEAEAKSAAPIAPASEVSLAPPDTVASGHSDGPADTLVVNEPVVETVAQPKPAFDLQAFRKAAMESASGPADDQ